MMTPVTSAWMAKLMKLTMPPANSCPHIKPLSLAMTWLLSALWRRNQTAPIKTPAHPGRTRHGEEWQNQESQSQRQAAADAASEGQAAALAVVVGQSREPRHDGALSRALHELRPHAKGTALRQTDHRH